MSKAFLLEPLITFLVYHFPYLPSEYVATPLWPELSSISWVETELVAPEMVEKGALT